MSWAKELFTSTGFVSAMIGTIVGGVITMVGQHLAIEETRHQKREDQRLVQLASCSSLLFKLHRIASNLENTRALFQEMFDNAKTNGMDLSQPCTFCLPIGNPGDDSLRFEAAELGLFIQHSRKDLFNDVVALDDLNFAFIQLIVGFNEKRNSLSSKITPKVFSSDDGRGSADLDHDEALRLLPLMHDCNSIIYRILETAGECERVWNAAQGVAKFQGQVLGVKVNFERTRAPKHFSANDAQAEPSKSSGIFSA